MFNSPWQPKLNNKTPTNTTVVTTTKNARPVLAPIVDAQPAATTTTTTTSTTTTTNSNTSIIPYAGPYGLTNADDKQGTKRTNVPATKVDLPQFISINTDINAAKV
jgi:hypothetical protein